jgi:iduronate 2-sulfatase
MIVYDPRMPQSARGQRRSELVAVPDLAPTVCDLVGVDPAETVQGGSLRPLIEGADTDWRDTLVAEQLLDW